MISLLQRVRQARVEVDGQVVGAIGAGLLVLVCAERGDTEAEADKLLAKMLKLRIFSDDAGKMPTPRAATAPVSRRRRPPMRAAGFMTTWWHRPALPIPRWPRAGLRPTCRCTW